MRSADETIFLVRRSHPETNQRSHTRDRTTRFDHVSGGNRGLPMKHSIGVRNCSRYPSHCCNHNAVVAVTFDRASCRRYSDRSLQEFPQPDRSKCFGTIALLTMGFVSLNRGLGLPLGHQCQAPEGMIARLMSVPSRHFKAGRKFVVNHPLTILRGTVAALFSQSYVSP